MNGTDLIWVEVNPEGALFAMRVCVNNEHNYLEHPRGRQ